MQTLDLRNQSLVKVIYQDGDLPQRMKHGHTEDSEKRNDQHSGRPGIPVGQQFKDSSQVQEQNPFLNATNPAIGGSNTNTHGQGMGTFGMDGANRMDGMGGLNGQAINRFGTSTSPGLNGQIAGNISGTGEQGINGVGGQMSGNMSGMAGQGFGMGGQGINSQISGNPSGMVGQGFNGMGGMSEHLGMGQGIHGMGNMSGQGIDGMGGQGTAGLGSINRISGTAGGMNGQGINEMGGIHRFSGVGANGMGGQMSGMNSQGFNGMGGMSGFKGADSGIVGSNIYNSGMSSSQHFDRMEGPPRYPGAQQTTSQFGSSHLSSQSGGYPGANFTGAMGAQSFNNHTRSDINSQYNGQWQGQGQSQGQSMHGGFQTIGGGVGPYQSMQSTGYPGMAAPQYGTQSQTTVLLTTNQVTGQTQPHWINNIVKPQPKDEIELLREWFSAVDQDSSGSISQEELGSALEAGGDKFNFYTVKMMIDMFDRNSRGLIDFLEFTYLFGYIKTMRASFEGYDVNRVGALGVNEINQALLHAGYRFANPQTLLFLCDKFDKRRKGHLSFENFLELGVYLGSMRTAFQKHGWPTDGNGGYVTPQFEAFVVQELAKLR